jgi:hypothetical protein
MAPAGLAWKRAMEQRPSLNLYGPDREHPSMAGTYLTTAVLYATVFGKDPSSSTYQPSGISAEDGAFLRRLAWEIVQANDRPNRGRP